MATNPSDSVTNPSDMVTKATLKNVDDLAKVSTSSKLVKSYFKYIRLTYDSIYFKVNDKLGYGD